MSISLEQATPVTAAQRALGLLKGKDNPFEVLASGQRADDNFHELHVPALHQRERDLLFQIIDAYRLSDYADSDRLQKTRVVTVQGARGSGKTHLLQSLVARADLKPQVVVRPAFFEPSLEFEEYLLAPLRTALAQQSLDTLSPDEYIPRLVSIMETAQTRHVKLWLAGKAQNWELAAYELRQLKASEGTSSNLVAWFAAHDHMTSDSEEIDDATA